MKRYLWCLLVFSFVTIANADSNTIEDTTQNRIFEANRYLSVMPPNDMLLDMVQKMSAQIPVEKRQYFIDLMTKHLDTKKFTSIMRDAMVKNFTANELQALANFYGSDVGRSATKKFGQYMADAMPHIQALMKDAYQKSKAEIEKQ